MSSSTRANHPKVPVTQITGAAPQVMINVLRRSEARTVQENSHILQGTRVILPVDNKRSVVIYSNNPSDWNTVSAVAKLYVTTETLPFVEHNLPKSLKTLAEYLGIVVFWVGFVTLSGALSLKLAKYLSSVTVGIQFASQAASSTSVLLRRWSQDASSQAAGAYVRSAHFLHVAIQTILKVIITSLEACIAHGSRLLEDSAATTAAETAL